MLSRTAVYALRCCAHLVGRDEPLGAQPLAATLGVPPSYLQKVLRRLVAGGLLASRKGWGGGFTLACDPARTPLAAVVACVQDDGPLEACVFGRDFCSDDESCPAHLYWKQIRGVWHLMLDRLTLQDMADLERRQRTPSP